MRRRSSPGAYSRSWKISVEIVPAAAGRVAVALLRHGGGERKIDPGREHVRQGGRARGDVFHFQWYGKNAAYIEKACPFHRRGDLTAAAALHEKAQLLRALRRNGAAQQRDRFLACERVHRAHAEERARTQQRVIFHEEHRLRRGALRHRGREREREAHAPPRRKSEQKRYSRQKQHSDRRAQPERAASGSPDRRKCRRSQKPQHGGGDLACFHFRNSCTSGFFTSPIMLSMSCSAVYSFKRALALRMRRWPHTNGNTSATSSGIT